MALLKLKSWKHLASATASVVALCGAAAFAGCSGSSSDTPKEAPTKTIYEGTIYMASTGGGHIAVVPVTIDPSNATAPITVDLAKLDKIQLKGFGAEAGFGAGNTTHNFHDVRLDGRKLYYSAIKVDSTATANAGKVHLGWVDLDDLTAEHDAVLDAAPTGTAMVYCGSGQTATHFVPMTMSHPAYIDAISKSDLAGNGAILASGPGATDVKRTFIEAFRTADSDYIFAHGVNSPNGEQLFVAVNDTTAGAGGTTSGMSGSVTGYLLKMSDVVAGLVDDQSVMATNTITGLGTGGSTIAFRSTFTSDGKILQAGKDRLLVLNPDLTLEHQNTTIGGAYTAVENHDVMPTPDGKYAILALRFKYSETGKMDSGLQLYNLTNHTAIGNPVSACNACHRPSDPTADTKDRATCGLDGSLTAKAVPE